MVAIRKNKKSTVKTYLPAHVVYEEIDGWALPYKGYKEVLAEKFKTEDIMGSSSLQSIIIYLLNGWLFNLLNRKKYVVATNESGLRIAKNTNFANDIAIYEREGLTLNDKYFQVAPKVVVEIDVKIDLDDTPLERDLDYMLAKTQKMLDFGTERVIWIQTKTKKILVSEANKPWMMVNFTDDIELMPNIILNLAKLLSDEDIPF